MIAQVKTIDGQKKIIPLTADTGSGNPVGTILALYTNKVPNGYLPCNGSAYDTTQFPALYAILRSDTLPDLREVTLKGIGLNSNATDHVSANGLNIGEYLDDRLQDHKHAISLRPNKPVADGPSAGDFGYKGSLESNETGNVTSAYRSGATTEVKSVGVFFVIKATSGLEEGQQDYVLGVLKDWVEDAETYSTTEVKTNKTWIDGKPIYRIVLTTTSSITSSSSSWGGLETTISNLNLERCIYADVAASGGGNFPVQFSATSGFRTYGDAVANAGVNIILEYTKTTD